MAAGPTLRLPQPDGTLRAYTLRAPVAWRASRFTGRVADPLADNTPGAPAVIDWDATLVHRRHWWDSGPAVAEAMDTAQRGMGLDWPAAAELIRRSAAEARSVGGVLARDRERVVDDR